MLISLDPKCLPGSMLYSCILPDTSAFAATLEQKLIYYHPQGCNIELLLGILIKTLTVE